MGDNATKDFILRHVFGIAAELIGGEVELLRALLRLHYGKLQIPLMLAERLIQALKGHDGFKAWPLSEIVPDDEAFFAFLQERWPLFLSRLGSAHQVREDSPEYGLKSVSYTHLGCQQTHPARPAASPSSRLWQRFCQLPSRLSGSCHSCLRS